MLLKTRKILLGLALSLILLPMISFASTEFKGTETVNINKANAATLAAYLKGIGPNKAEAIVKYRKSNGSFKSSADIQNVPGVGETTFKDIKSKISTSRGKSTAPKGYKLGESSGKSTTSKKKTTKKSSAKKTIDKKSTAKKTTAKKTAKKTTDKKTTKKKSTKVKESAADKKKAAALKKKKAAAAKKKKAAALKKKKAAEKKKK